MGWENKLDPAPLLVPNDQMSMGEVVEELFLPIPPMPIPPPFALSLLPPLPMIPITVAAAVAVEEG